MGWIGYLFFLLWIGILIAESRVSGSIWSSMLGRAFNVLALPGIMVHEFSHAFGCLITGAKVTSISLFEPQGGYVTHSDPKLPIIGRPIVSFAPLVGCGLALWFVFYIFHHGSGPWPNLLPMDLNLTAAGIQKFVRDIYLVLEQPVKAVQDADYKLISTYLFAYLAVSIGVAFSPSRQDLRSAGISLLVTVALVVIADLVARNFGMKEGLANVLLPPIWPVLSFAVGLMAVVLVISVVAWGLDRIITSTTGHGEESGKGGGKSSGAGKGKKPGAGGSDAG